MTAHRLFIATLMAGLFFSLAVNGRAFEQSQGGVNWSPYLGTGNAGGSLYLQKVWRAHGSEAKGIGVKAGTALSYQVQDLKTLIDRIHLLRYEDIPLAKAIQNSELFREVLSKLEFSDSRERQSHERALIMAMVRYLQAARVVSPDDHQRNLRFFRDLVEVISGHSGVEIADLAFADQAGAFRVPAQFLQGGHRGALGAILDTLQDSNYVVRPQVKRWFERPSWLRWFDSSV
jgi:hypothetical protein